jgi:HAD superfamily phosphatase (TIGR01668 family)
MLQIFFRLSHFIPYDCRKTIFDIDYTKLYESGKRIILMDIDNTVIPYDVAVPTEIIMGFFEKIRKMGFKLIFISNNNNERVSVFAKAMGADFISQAWKPFKRGYNKAIALAKPYTKKQMISVGDQLMTDILGSNRMGIEAILVAPLKKKSEKWYTKVNRIAEEHVLKKLKRQYPDIYRRIEEIQ